MQFHTSYPCLNSLQALFERTLMPDAITFEAFIAACGIAGAPEKVSEM